MNAHAHSRSSHAGVRFRRGNGLLAALLGYDSVFRQRRALGRLDPHIRRDIGLSEVDIGRESSRSVWDIPEWWR